MGLDDESKAFEYGRHPPPITGMTYIEGRSFREESTREGVEVLMKKVHGRSVELVPGFTGERDGVETTRVDVNGPKIGGHGCSFVMRVSICRMVSRVASMAR
jgi:hypothetical protein